MRKTLLACILALSAVCPVFAQERTVLLIPMEMKGNYKPVSSDDLTKMLKADIEKAAPDVKVVVGSPAYMLQPEDAAKLGKQAGTGYVLYGDVRFRTEAKGASVTGSPPEGYPNDGSIPAGFSMRYLVTVGGVAHGYLVDCSNARLLAEEPQLLFESEMTGGAKDGPVMQEVEQRLADKCVREMSQGLVEQIQASVKSQKK